MVGAGLLLASGNAFEANGVAVARAPCPAGASACPASWKETCARGILSPVLRGLSFCRISNLEHPWSSHVEVGTRRYILAPRRGAYSARSFLAPQPYGRAAFDPALVRRFAGSFFWGPSTCRAVV